MKAVAFRVQATAEQAASWLRAALAQGHRSVDRWLEDAADVYLTSAAEPARLTWRRERFRVHFEDGREYEVLGAVSLPFGVFRGTTEGPGRPAFSLVYLPDRRILATLAKARDCKALAGALSSSPINWRDPDPR